MKEIWTAALGASAASAGTDLVQVLCEFVWKWVELLVSFGWPLFKTMKCKIIDEFSIFFFAV